MPYAKKTLSISKGPIWSKRIAIPFNRIPTCGSQTRTSWRILRFTQPKDFYSRVPAQTFPFPV